MEATKSCWVGGTILGHRNHRVTTNNLGTTSDSGRSPGLGSHCVFISSRHIYPKLNSQKLRTSHLHPWKFPHPLSNTVTKNAGSRVRLPALTSQLHHLFTVSLQTSYQPSKFPIPYLWSRYNNSYLTGILVKTRWDNAYAKHRVTNISYYYHYCLLKANPYKSGKHHNEIIIPFIP